MKPATLFLLLANVVAFAYGAPMEQPTIMVSYQIPSDWVNIPLGKCLPYTQPSTGKVPTSGLANRDDTWCQYHSDENCSVMNVVYTFSPGRSVGLFEPPPLGSSVKSFTCNVNSIDTSDMPVSDTPPFP